MFRFWTMASFALALAMSATWAQGLSQAFDGGSSSAEGHSPSGEPARAQGAVPTAFDATMTLIGATEQLPEAVTRNLELPKDDSGAFLPAPQAVSRSAEGLSTATLARRDGRAFGRATAEAARERAGAETRAAADEAREAGRALAEAAAIAADQLREDLRGSRPAFGGLPGGPALPTVPVHAILPAGSLGP